ncbi:hypothetical protein ACP4OV_006602 [Aristida adscensionis]
MEAAEAEAEAEAGMRKEREAAERTESREAGGSREEGGIRCGGAEAEEEVEEEEEELADGGEGDGYKRDEEEEAIGGKGRKQRHQRRQQEQEQEPPRAPVAAGHRAPWRARGGRGRGGGGGGFHQRPWNLQHHKSNTSHKPEVYSGAIIICNRMTKREFLKQKIFALPGYAATFIKKIRAGMLLFLFEHEERKLYGVFEATSDGALDILPDAFASLWKFRPAQVLFRRVWFCKPVTEAEFPVAIKGNCLQPHMSFFGISYLQVLDLVNLFSSKMIQLQPYQKPKSSVLWDFRMSLARTGREFRVHTHSNPYARRSSSMFCNNRTSLLHSPFMSAKHSGKRPAHEPESSLHPCSKPLAFKAPVIKNKSLEPDDNYIPLELDDLDDYKCDSDADQSTLLGTVSFYSTSESNISSEDQVAKPFKGKHNVDDSCHLSVLNQKLISESETDRNSLIAHMMKEGKSNLQAKGCKRKAIVHLDGFSDLAAPKKGRTVAKRVSFSFGGDGIAVTSDKTSHKPALAELEQTREAVLKEGKQGVGFSPQDIQIKERDVSAKRSKLMNLSFAERLRNQLAESCSRNSQPLVSQSGIKLTCTLLTDQE